MVMGYRSDQSHGQAQSPEPPGKSENTQRVREKVVCFQLPQNMTYFFFVLKQNLLILFGNLGNKSVQIIIFFLKIPTILTD